MVEDLQPDGTWEGEGMYDAVDEAWARRMRAETETTAPETAGASWLDQYQATKEQKLEELGAWLRETFPFKGQKGGPGSGHHGHAGRPGKRGGSVPGKVGQSSRAAMGVDRAREWVQKKGVRRVKGEDRPLSGKTAEKLANVIARHPENVLRHIDKIRIAPGKEFESEFSYFGMAGSPMSAEGFWVGKYRQVVVRSARQDLLDHEIGHATYQSSKGKRAWIQAYREDPNFDRHTDYARTNASEGFAEAYAAYLAYGGQQPQFAGMDRTFEVLQQVIEAPAAWGWE